MTWLIYNLILAHPVGSLALSGLVGTAFASTFPEKRPKTLDDYWTWAKDFIHQLTNAKRPTNQNP